MYSRFSAALTTIALFALLLGAPGAADARPYDSSDGLIGLGWSQARGDFNGDGKDDLARGHLRERDYDGSPTGLVYVAYGTSSGLQDVQLLRPAPLVVVEPGFAGLVSFGGIVVAANLDGDLYDDLIVTSRGQLVVFRGSQTGLVPWTKRAMPTDFVSALRVANYDGGKREEIAATIYASGRSTTWFLSGLELEHAQSFEQVAAAADFDRDGKDEVVVATPGVGLSIYAFDGELWTLWQAVPWPAYLGAYTYGSSPVAGDFNSDGLMDLAVWAAGDTQTPARYGYPGPGALWLFKNGRRGLEPWRSLAIQPGHTTPTVGDFDGDGYDDLAIPSRGAAALYGGNARIVPKSKSSTSPAYYRQARAIVVFHGGPDGATFADQIETDPLHTDFGVNGVAGDFDGDCLTELAAGVSDWNTTWILTGASMQVRQELEETRGVGDIPIGPAPPLFLRPPDPRFARCAARLPVNATPDLVPEAASTAAGVAAFAALVALARRRSLPSPSQLVSR